MTWVAASRPAVVAFASPVSQPPRPRHSARISGPPARWIAPSTPPPPSRLEFAALTIASTRCCVISPRTASITSEKLALGGSQARRLKAAELDEHAGDDRVELRPRATVDLRERVADRQRRPVRPRRDHRVEVVGDGEHASLERNRSAAAPVRVAPPVPVLVVEENVRDREAEVRLLGEDAHTRVRVPANLLQLDLAQSIGLVPDRVCDGQLADIVEQRAD